MLIGRHGKCTNFNKMVDYGDSVEQVIINLLACDGDKSRSNRKALLSNDMKEIGVASGEHNTNGTCSVIALATKFEVD